MKLHINCFGQISNEGQEKFPNYSPLVVKKTITVEETPNELPEDDEAWQKFIREKLMEEGETPLEFEKFVVLSTADFQKGFELMWKGEVGLL